MEHAVGGAIDVATVTADDGLQFIRRKPPQGAVPVEWRDIEVPDGGVIDAPSDYTRMATYTLNQPWVSKNC